MRSVRTVHVVGCHAAGEVGDVIVGGVAPPPGDTLWEQSRHIARDQSLRNFVLNEPRGGVFRHVNLLVPPRHPDAAMGYIIMEPVHTPPMSGSNTICVATVLLETGIIPMQEPVSEFLLEAPGGLVPVRAECRDGRVVSVTLRNRPSFAQKLDCPLEVEGLGTLSVDTAFGGDTFVLVDAAALGFRIDPSEALDLAQLGARITRAASEQIGFSHPDHPDWTHISFCQFTGPVETGPVGEVARNTVAIEPGKLDRSPTGTGLSARMAVRHARGEMGVGDRMTALSIIGSSFEGAIAGLAEVGGVPAILPDITGSAFITGTSQLMLDPHDPWPEGYRVADTWPGA